MAKMPEPFDVKAILKREEEKKIKRQFDKLIRQETKGTCFNMWDHMGKD
jgi:hypothetical protein